MTDLRTELKDLVRREIEQNLATLIGISDWMYHNPELGLQEFQASEKLTDVMAEYGATIQRGVAGMPTAFVADLPGGKPGCHRGGQQISTSGCFPVEHFTRTEYARQGA